MMGLPCLGILSIYRCAFLPTQLRRGGLTTSDQILVAEKAGSWGEALALYEHELGKEAAPSRCHSVKGEARLDPPNPS